MTCRLGNIIYFTATTLAVMILAAAGYLATQMVDFPDMCFSLAAGWALAVLCYSCGHEVQRVACSLTKAGGRGKEHA